MHENEGELEGRARTAAHEWFHGWVGLWDEYKKNDQTPSSCPENILVRTTWDACIMYSSQGHTELCRKENHNPATIQGEMRKMSCYEWLVKAAKDDGKAEIKIPESHLRGPEDPPEPAFEVKW